MAQLYFDHQLIATSESHGILAPNMLTKDFSLVYKANANKYYTIIIHDENDVHLFLLNVLGNDLTKGDEVVTYMPFETKKYNNDVTVCIYEQPKLIHVDDDFDLDPFIVNHKLKLRYLIDFTILQKIEKKPNIFSNRVFNQKLKSYKK